MKDEWRTKGRREMGLPSCEGQMLSAMTCFCFEKWEEKIKIETGKDEIWMFIWVLP